LKSVVLIQLFGSADERRYDLFRAPRVFVIWIAAIRDPYGLDALPEDTWLARRAMVDDQDGVDRL